MRAAAGAAEGRRRGAGSAVLGVRRVGRLDFHAVEALFDRALLLLEPGQMIPERLALGFRLRRGGGRRRLLARAPRAAELDPITMRTGRISPSRRIVASVS